MAKKNDILESAEALIEAIKHCKSSHMQSIGETKLDPILYAYFLGKFNKVDRQYHCKLPTSKKPSRIDFRIGGSNPALIELVVRTKKAQSNLYGDQNKRELRKLGSIGNTKAKQRILLLIDLCKTPIPKNKLKESYKKTHLGKGKFPRNSVRVIYVHANDKYDFCYKPYKNK